MFHRFSRLSGVSRAVQTRYVVCNNKKIAVLLNYPRFYCKSSGSHGPNDDKKVNNSDVCGGVRKRRPLNVCKPAYPRPCIPTPPPNRLGPLECPPGLNRMDKMPKPACPYDEEHDKQNKKYLRHLLLGLLVTAATLAALWYNLEFTKKDVNRKPKKEKKFTRPKPTCRIPPNASALPKHVPYLLIGGGTASFSAFRAIKSSDPTAKVLVISNECYYPYMRTPLSKEMWFTNEQNVNKLIFKQWNGTERSLFYEHEEFYTTPQSLNNSENGGVAVAQGYSVTKIDPVERIAYLDDGTQISYDKCLIATGARPKNLDVFKSASPQIQDKVTLYRDIFDFQELDEICKDAKSVAIIGSGFLGSELACALGKTGQKRGMKVYQIFREAGNMGRVLPEYLSHWTTERVRKEGVTIVNNTEVEDVTLKNKNELILHLNNGSKVIANHVIVAVGVEPNTELAKASRLEVDPELGGFLVNAEMEARSNLYVAGDCCCFYDVILGRRRVEHHDHAVVSGRLAGENMTGAAKPYLHQSMFWSDLGPEVGYEAIGRVDSSLPTVGVFAKATEADSPKAVVTATDNNLRSATEEKSKEPAPKKEKSQKNETNVTGDEYGKGVIFYLKDDIVVGIVLWNVFNRMSVARQVLKDERKYDDLNEVAKLFNIHEE